MARSYFAILGVPSNASPEQIRSAYRRRAKEFHPDHSGGDSGLFRELQEAYAVLSDPRRRRAYERSLTAAARPIASPPICHPGPEPLLRREGGPDIRASSSYRVSRSSDAFLEGIFEGFSPRPRPRSGWTVTVPLRRRQAARGGRVRVGVPALLVCPTCSGYGGLGIYECPHCAGQGALWTEQAVAVPFPAGLQSEHAVVIPLAQFGLPHLQLTVVFRVQESGE